MQEAVPQAPLTPEQNHRLERLDNWMKSIFIALEEGKDQNIGNLQAFWNHHDRMNSK